PAAPPAAHSFPTRRSSDLAQDNWVDANKNGILDGSLLSDYKSATVMDSPFEYPAGVVGKLSAADALAHVIQNVGASLVRDEVDEDRKSTRLNSSHVKISYA